MPARPLLFDVPGAARSGGERRARARGDFGEVRWGCGSPPDARADEAWSAPGVSVFAWDRPPFRIELMVIDAIPELPGGMRVRGAWIGYWRLRSSAEAAPVPLTCWISDGLDRLEGGPSSGEELDAQTWDGDGHRVTIGTEDSEALAARAGRDVPAAWKDDLLAWDGGRARGRMAYPVAFTPEGVALVLDAVPAGMVCEFHHAVAWQRTTDGEASSWYAVDLLRATPPPPIPET